MGLLSKLFSETIDHREDIRRRTQSTSRYHAVLGGSLDGYLNPERTSDLLYRAAYTNDSSPDAVDLRRSLSLICPSKGYDTSVHAAITRFNPTFFDRFHSTPTPLHDK